MEQPAAYPVGAKVVHPNYGAGIVIGIEVRSISETSHSYYVVETHALKLMVPIHRASAVGLRHVGRADILRKTLERCCEPPSADEIVSDRLSRQAASDKKLKSGSFEQAVSVVRELYFLRSRRALATLDHQLYERGMQILASELALASDQKLDQAIVEIEGFLARMLRGAKPAKI